MVENGLTVLSTAFDSIFAAHAGALPVAFLRSLAWRESSMRPTLHTGPAVGLLQIVPILQKEWNRRTGQSVTQEDLKNPDLNTKIASDLLNRIISGYSKIGAPNLRANWQNPEFVKLLVAGWNSGYSDAAGVGKVARWLMQNGLPVTHDNVFRYAAQAGGVQWLQMPSRQSWQKSVADLFYQQPDASRPAPSPVPVVAKEASKREFLIKASIATVVGLLAAKFVFR